MAPARAQMAPIRSGQRRALPAPRPRAWSRGASTSRIAAVRSPRASRKGSGRRGGPGLPHLHQLAPGGLAGLVHVVGAGGAPDHDLRAAVRGRLREGLDGGRVGAGQGGGGAEQDGPGGAGGDHRGRGADLPRDLAPGGLLEGPQGDVAPAASFIACSTSGGISEPPWAVLCPEALMKRLHAESRVHSGRVPLGLAPRRVSVPSLPRLPAAHRAGAPVGALPAPPGRTIAPA